MAPCSTCFLSHPIVAGVPNDCVKALAAELAAVKAGGADAALAARVSTLESAVNHGIPGTLAQKVCFTTHEALADRVAALESFARGGLPPATPAGDASTPVTGS